MDLASASMLPTTSRSISTLANESVLVLNRTTRSLPRTGDPIWSLRLATPGQPVQHFDAVSGRGRTVRTLIVIALAPARRFPPAL